MAQSIHVQIRQASAVALESLIDAGTDHVECGAFDRFQLIELFKAVRDRLPELDELEPALNLLARISVNAGSLEGLDLSLVTDQMDQASTGELLHMILMLANSDDARSLETLQHLAGHPSAEISCEARQAVGELRARIAVR